MTRKQGTTNLVALVAVDIYSWPHLVRGTPSEWWEQMLQGDNFVDIFDAKTPEEPGIYWWRGYYRPNQNAGRAMPNGEMDDWPGQWIGVFTKDGI